MDNIYELEGAGTEISAFIYNYENSGGKYGTAYFSIPGIDLKLSFTGTKVISLNKILDFVKSNANKGINKLKQLLS